jgi:hypothetical protein
MSTIEAVREKRTPTPASVWQAVVGTTIGDELLEWPPDLFAATGRDPRAFGGVPLRLVAAGWGGVATHPDSRVGRCGCRRESAMERLGRGQSR